MVIFMASVPASGPESPRQGSGNVHAARERPCDREYDCFRYFALWRLFSRFRLLGLAGYCKLAMLKPEATTWMEQVVEACLSITQELLCTIDVHDLYHRMGCLAVHPILPQVPHILSGIFLIPAPKPDTLPRTTCLLM